MGEFWPFGRGRSWLSSLSFWVAAPLRLVLGGFAHGSASVDISVRVHHQCKCCSAPLYHCCAGTSVRSPPSSSVLNRCALRLLLLHVCPQPLCYPPKSRTSAAAANGNVLPEQLCSVTLSLCCALTPVCRRYCFCFCFVYLPISSLFSCVSLVLCKNMHVCHPESSCGRFIEML